MSKTTLEALNGKPVTLYNQAKEDSDYSKPQIQINGILEDHEEGEWFVRAPETFGDVCGIGFNKRHVLEVETMNSGRNVIVIE